MYNDCLSCDFNFPIEKNGICFCEDGYFDNGKGGCDHCGVGKEGDGNGGCKCETGLEGIF